ncbi:hypothetical protein [Phenylobacterium sp.]|jgi:hypothetical protein|uniref:hypothetical protein n=1 Tax=Phenylobacterium sp. TaxID=1871053 RepID=UPI002F935569
MRPKAFGLVAALVAAVLVPAAAMSQAKKGDAGGVTEAARKSGMAEAPAIAQSLGLNCQVTDARLVGKQEDKKAKTSTSFYEVACQQGMGFVIQAPSGGQASAFTCIEANTVQAGQEKAGLPCILPANSDPKAVLTPMLQKAGVQCVPENTRGIGQSKTQTFMEVACQGGTGYVVIGSAPFDPTKPIQAQNCLNFDDGEGNIKCLIGDKAKRLQIIDAYAQAAANGCVVMDRRFIGTAKDNANYYEASCQDGKGYVYKVTGAGKLESALECAKAVHVLGGCQLTDARQAQNEQAGLYSRLAKNAGSTCEVDKYALFPVRGNEEVVELLCKDGKSVLGMFPATGKGQVLDCGRALVAGYKCGLGGKIDYASLTADLRKFDQKTCEVSNSRLAAKTAKGTTLVEVACADGYKGYMIEYQTTPSVNAVAATGCAFMAGCQLPGNKS